MGSSHSAPRRESSRNNSHRRSQRSIRYDQEIPVDSSNESSEWKEDLPAMMVSPPARGGTEERTKRRPQKGTGEEINSRLNKQRSKTRKKAYNPLSPTSRDSRREQTSPTGNTRSPRTTSDANAVTRNMDQEPDTVVISPDTPSRVSSNDYPDMAQETDRHPHSPAPFPASPGGRDSPVLVADGSLLPNNHRTPRFHPPPDQSNFMFGENDSDFVTSNMVAPVSIGPPPDFYPQVSGNFEWMGRSLETLVLGYGAVAPILCLPEDEDERSDEASHWGAVRRRSTMSTLGSDFGPRSSLGSLHSSRRGSLVGNGNMHGGTLANYYNNRRRGTGGGEIGSRRGSAASINRRGSAHSGGHRRGSASHGPSYRRRMNRRGSTAEGDESNTRSSGPRGGPNITLSLLGRETVGRRLSKNVKPATAQLHALGGHTLFNTLDRPAGGMCSEVAFLSEVIDSGDWAETQTVISRISPRLIGDPSAAVAGRGQERPVINDPNLAPTVSPFYAGGGRIGLERDAFVLAGGVEILLRIFREPSFVGAEMAASYDAQDLSVELVANRLAPCWNETLACLRELVYAIPTLVDLYLSFDNGDFLPFLFTLLAHDTCFDGAAALIEEILSLQSHSPAQASPEVSNPIETPPSYQATVRVSPPTTFFLGNVPGLYKLWNGFNCRQLAHFCRTLALLVFEPEDRQLLESPAVLKSIELLQLRRNRANRAGRDSTVDMNQAILLGDDELIEKLLKLLQVMNFAPSLRRSAPYHVIAHFPFIADTLVMLGLQELDKWPEVDRLEKLARTMLSEEIDGEEPHLSELGSVADMLESLSEVLSGDQGPTPSNQLGHIIHVISAAQHAGVVVGRPRQGGRSRRRSQTTSQELFSHEQDENTDRRATSQEGSTTRLDTLDADRLNSTVDSTVEAGNQSDATPSIQIVRVDGGNGGGRTGVAVEPYSSRRPRIQNPDDAANALQFNALLLGPYQVEVLFVLCTLLGGGRRIDAQESLKSRGMVAILDDMFQRLPWDSLSSSRSTRRSRRNENQHGRSDTATDNQQQDGMHGPGCECTPESALCVQYLRLLHNFCDRDCDNYTGRRLLLSEAERTFVFSSHSGTGYEISRLQPGLLSKLVAAFIGESDESPYRFWLASCVESYLRGSSSAEQVFVAQTGLLKHLLSDITSERLHCAGSLQTSFDLLGELCKGNSDVLTLLVGDLDEESFRKLMSVAAANLVDSNVFIRSLLLSLERISSANQLMPLHLEPDLFVGRRGSWISNNGSSSRSYLTHSWWDCNLGTTHQRKVDNDHSRTAEENCDGNRPSDWFPNIGIVDACKMQPPKEVSFSSSGLHDGVGHFGWVFTPEGETLSAAALAPNTIERLSWFLAANQTRLLRDLLGVVDLRNINHENICCLNTAVVVAIFAHRRQQLHTLLEEIRRMGLEERENKRRALDAAKKDDVVDRAFVQAMKYLDIDREITPAPYARRASLSRRCSLTSGSNIDAGDRNDVLTNFREVLWFWVEYYTHRGRDRLSLEFSSHLRFSEWIEVVTLLGADNNNPSSLINSPVRLPRSPYQNAARVTENPLRGL